MKIKFNKRKEHSAKYSAESSLPYSLPCVNLPLPMLFNEGQSESPFLKSLEILSLGDLGSRLVNEMVTMKKTDSDTKINSDFTYLLLGLIRTIRIRTSKITWEFEEIFKKILMSDY